MLTEQTIEFELSKPSAPGCTCTSKIKIFKENLRVDYYLLLKHSRSQRTLLPPTWAKSLTKSNTKIHTFQTGA